MDDSGYEIGLVVDNLLFPREFIRDMQPVKPAEFTFAPFLSSIEQGGVRAGAFSLLLRETAHRRALLRGDGLARLEDKVHPGDNRLSGAEVGRELHDKSWFASTASAPDDLLDLVVRNDIRPAKAAHG